MAQSFKKWLSLDEIALSSNGQRNNQPTQTVQATAQVAQNWLGQDANVDAQSRLINVKNRSVLGKQLIGAGADAIEAAPNTVAQRTTAPAVAGFLQTQFKLPNVIKQNPVKMMRKK